MRVSIVSTLLAGALLALGACASTGPGAMTLAERAGQCRSGEVIPTGRQTGDARADYDCRASHVSSGVFDRRERNINPTAGRAAAVRRANGGG
ncbi:MAG: hypothetical protein ACXW3O_03735 [Brevundimonas sp.]